jgi:MFS superfamily sulfate permease-like transporter
MYWRDWWWARRPAAGHGIRHRLGRPAGAGLLYTAIVAALLTSLFGGTRVQISGPTGAIHRRA